MSQSNIKRDLDTVIQEVQSVLNHALSSPGSEGTAAKVKESLASAQAKLQVLAHDAKVRAQDMARSTDQFVHERPWQAIGLGAAAGWLIGFWASRR